MLHVYENQNKFSKIRHEFWLRISNIWEMKIMIINSKMFFCSRRSDRNSYTADDGLLPCYCQVQDGGEMGWREPVGSSQSVARQKLENWYQKLHNTTKNNNVNTKIQFQIRLLNPFSWVQENSHCVCIEYGFVAPPMCTIWKSKNKKESDQEEQNWQLRLKTYC